MKELILTTVALIGTGIGSSAQEKGLNQETEREESIRSELGLTLHSTVMLYPKGQNVDEGIALGPGESNGCTEEEYTEANGNRHNVGDFARFDLYIPEHPNGQMVIICPGGGYTITATRNEGMYLSKMLMDHGIASAVLHYRMPHGHWIVPLTDVQNTFRYCRAHASEWGIRQIGVYGASAGGHLAASASTLYVDDITRPDFTILYYPVISFEDSMAHQGTKKNLLGEHHEDPVLTERYSLEKQVTGNTPRAFIVLCQDDTAVPMENGIRYFSALRANKVQGELHIYPHGGHGWGRDLNEYTGKTDSFEYARPTFDPVLLRWLEEVRNQ